MSCFEEGSRALAGLKALEINDDWQQFYLNKIEIVKRILR
jgi:hypothetical protein